MNYRNITAILAGALLLLSAPETTAFADDQTKTMDTGIGGITRLMDDYYNSIYQAKQEELYIGGVKMKAVHRVPSPYENLGIANVRNYVNIRSGPSTDYKIIGKLYNGCVANILEYEGDWVKIQSGNVTEGYIKAEYLLIGWDA